MSAKAEADRLPDPPAEVYAGAPLRAVAVECHFARLLDAHARLGTFQRKHRADFPRAVADDDDDRDTVLLLNGANERGVAIASTSVTLITYAYAGGFEAFQAWALPLLDEALDLLDVSQFTALVYRYENVFAVEAPGGVEDLLRVQLPRHPSALARSGVRDLTLMWQQPWPRGMVTVDLGAYGEPPAHVHLDITARRVGPLQRDAIHEAVREAHRMGRHTFEELITPAFRDRLRRAPS